MLLRRVLLVCAVLVGPMADAGAQTRAQVMAQAIPLVTRADPTAIRGPLTEGYVAQPIIMARAARAFWSAEAMINLEGLTLDRGELSTGAYGEGYVDRRHPHAYVHELLLGLEGSRGPFSASMFLGRGFAPFGSDDPMVRPMVKYPVNHHLAQILERLVAVVAIRRGPIIGEFGVFAGDEPLAPGSPPQLNRFADSWSGRLTVLPTDVMELSASLADVTSPELPQGHGLDQRKTSLVARYAATIGTTATYALAEWEATSERDRGRRVATLRSALAEGAACRGPLMLAARIERTDRAEEEPLLDPFRVARPSSDLNSLGISRWLTATASVTLSPWRGKASPFAEVARVSVSPGDPPGIFDPELRYGARTMWMYSVGMRLRAGQRHDRMGRYGVAAPSSKMGTMAHGTGSESMMTHSTHSCPF